MIKTDQSLSRLRSFGEKKSAPRESKRRRLRARRFVVTNSSLFSFSNPRESLEDVLTAADTKRRKEKKKSRNRSPLSHSRRPKNRTLTSLLFFVFTSTNLCTVFFREKARIGSVAGRKRAWILNATTRERFYDCAFLFARVTKKKKKKTIEFTRNTHCSSTRTRPSPRRRRTFATRSGRPLCSDR